MRKHTIVLLIAIAGLFTPACGAVNRSRVEPREDVRVLEHRRRPDFGEEPPRVTRADNKVGWGARRGPQP